MGDLHRVSLHGHPLPEGQVGGCAGKGSWPASGGEGACWERCASIPTNRLGVQGAIFESSGKIVLTGGNTILKGQSHFTTLSSVDIYDIASDSWTKGPDLQTPRVYGGAA